MTAVKFDEAQLFATIGQYGEGYAHSKSSTLQAVIGVDPAGCYVHCNVRADQAVY